MKTALIYSSKTGNTKKVGEAIFSVLPQGSQIFAIEDAPKLDDFDFLVLGYWVDRGTADPKMKKYMEAIEGKKVAIFGTLGAYPDSDHAKDVIGNVRKLLAKNDIVGSFICQGKVDSALVERMNKIPGHEMTPERKARLEEAAKHPNENDFANVKKTFCEILQAMGETPCEK